MNKMILSVFILALSIIAAIILYDIVATKYPDWDSFWKLLYVGLIVFGCGVCLFISGLLLERAINERAF